MDGSGKIEVRCLCVAVRSARIYALTVRAGAVDGVRGLRRRRRPPQEGQPQPALLAGLPGRRPGRAAGEGIALHRQSHARVS